MVAKISHGTSLYGALAYNYGKVAAGTAEILSGNRMISDRLGLPGTDIRLALLSFENYLLANRNTEKPVLHIALSPAPEDRLTDVQLEELAARYMEKMGYGDQPYIVYRHSDTHNTHIHIVSVCVDGEGRKISDAYEHRRSMAACRELETDFGLNKAVALVTRINRFFGSTWVAEDRRYPVRKTGKEGKGHTANIVITCTDNIRSRLDLWRFLKSCRKDTPPDHATPFYWMDFGNAQFTGQVLIGTVRNRIAQPASKEFIAIPKMNVITEEVSYSMIRDTDSGPSCSLTEALHKQDLFINSMLAQAGCEILWKMIREGRTPYRGAYLNMETLRLVPIPV